MAMTIKMGDLWRVAPGTEVATKTVVGMYLGREEWGHVIWTGCMDEVVEEWDDEEPVVVLDSGINVKKLLNAQAAKIVTLVNEGWRMDAGHHLLNLDPELDKLRVYAEVWKIVGNTEA